jgi:hypothetical protein
MSGRTWGPEAPDQPRIDGLGCLRWPGMASGRPGSQEVAGKQGHVSGDDGDEERIADQPVLSQALRHNESVAAAPRGRIPRGLSAKQRMARKLRTRRGREMYARRKGMIEPVFGQLKQVLGFRQFSLRGLSSMRGEWRLMATVHNLLKLWRHDQKVEMAG